MEDLDAQYFIRDTIYGEHILTISVNWLEGWFDELSKRFE